jgi:hypothetical protein
MCCNQSEAQGLSCCTASFPAGSNQLALCKNAVTVRWSKDKPAAGDDDEPVP